MKLFTIKELDSNACVVSKFVNEHGEILNKPYKTIYYTRGGMPGYVYMSRQDEEDWMGHRFENHQAMDIFCIFGNSTLECSGDIVQTMKKQLNRWSRIIRKNIQELNI